MKDISDCVLIFSRMLSLKHLNTFHRRKKILQENPKMAKRPSCFYLAAQSNYFQHISFIKKRKHFSNHNVSLC